MNNTAVTAIVAIVVGLAFGIGGFLLGRRAPEKEWHEERDGIKQQVADLAKEADELKNIVRISRMASRDRREYARMKSGKYPKRVSELLVYPDPIIPYRRGYDPVVGEFFRVRPGAAGMKPPQPGARPPGPPRGKPPSPPQGRPGPKAVPAPAPK